jgi:flagellar biosynthetic protein FliR
VELLWNRIPILSLVFIRIIAWVIAMPMIGAQSIPVQVKVGLSLGLAWALLPLLPLSATRPTLDLTYWAIAAVREALIGLSMGWLVHLCLAAVPLAGQLVGYQMGFGIANVVDPANQQQLSVIAQFLNVMALMLFFALNGHHLVIMALCKSFQLLPPATTAFQGGWLETGVAAGSNLFRSALLLAAPVMLILLFVKVGLAIVARAVPQMNVFIVALPMQIGVGLMALGATLSLLAPWLERGLDRLYDLFLMILMGVD